MKVLKIIFFLFIANFVYSQNIVEINNDDYTSMFYKNLEETLKKYKLDDIQNSNEKIIRIWRGQEVYSIKQKSDYQRIFKNNINDSIYVYKNTLNEKFVDLNIEQIKNLKASYPIDCIRIGIEIVENNHYFVKVVGCNKEISTIIYNIFKSGIENDIENFIKNLPSGEYQNYMTPFAINQPIKKDSDKTKFYKKLESELLDKNIEINNPRKQPLIRINSQTAYFEDINNIDESKIKSYEILSKELSILYGTRGKFGVIIIETN